MERRNYRIRARLCVDGPWMMPLCILDEAQNTTIMQMKMFLTRLGFNSKMIVEMGISVELTAT